MAANTKHITLQVEGMDCANCALGITKNLQKKGLEDVHVNFATGEATFVLEDKAKLQSIIDGIQGLGYTVIDAKTKAENEGKAIHCRKAFLLYASFYYCFVFQSYAIWARLYS